MGNRPLVHEGDNLKKTVTIIALGLGKLLETLAHGIKKHPQKHSHIYSVGTFLVVMD